MKRVLVGALAIVLVSALGALGALAGDTIDVTTLPACDTAKNHDAVVMESDGTYRAFAALEARKVTHPDAILCRDSSGKVKVEY
jgi:hypothetical protein